MPTRFSTLLLCAGLMLLSAAAATAQIDPRLLAAIEQNNPVGVQAALKADRTRPGANPNATDSLGATPLMWACYKADTAVVKLLIKAGASTQCRGVIQTDTSTYYGNLTGLAAGLNKLPMLRYLLETLKLPVNEPEHNPETKKNDGWTPAEWAAAHGHLDVLTYLNERGADLNVGKGNPMVLAVQYGHTTSIVFFLEKGFLLEKENPEYRLSVNKYLNQLNDLAVFYEEQKKYEKSTQYWKQIKTVYGQEIQGFLIKPFVWSKTELAS